MATNAERQAAYKARVRAKVDSADRMKVALDGIIVALNGNDKPMAVKIRILALEGLGR